MAMIVKFLKTGDQYEVIDLNLEMKNPETREWVRAVSYKRHKTLNRETGEMEDPTPEMSNRVFVREFRDFNEKFEPCFNM